MKSLGDGLVTITPPPGPVKLTPTEATLGDAIATATASLREAKIVEIKNSHPRKTTLGTIVLFFMITPETSWQLHLLDM